MKGLVFYVYIMFETDLFLTFRKKKNSEQVLKQKKKKYPEQNRTAKQLHKQYFVEEIHGMVKGNYYGGPHCFYCFVFASY